MNKFIKSGLLLIFIVFYIAAAQAQKFGYINLQTAIAELPKMKQLDAEMEAYQKQLQQQHLDMGTLLRTKLQNLQKRLTVDLVSPKQLEEERKKLEEEEQKILAHEQEMMQLLQSKRVALLKPIMDEFNAAVKAVATEGGYTYIFEQGILLYQDASLDVAPLVKKKLGL